VSAAAGGTRYRLIGVAVDQLVGNVTVNFLPGPGQLGEIWRLVLSGIAIPDVGST